MTEDLADARAAYGFKYLGPVIASFLQDLDGVLARLVTQRGGRALFVARGGLLIQHALNVYREAVGASAMAPEAPLYISRFMAAKGAWKHAPERTLAVLDREFGAATAAAYLQRLDPKLEIEADQTPAYASFSRFLEEDGPLQQASRAHLDRQAELVGRYTTGMVEGASLMALVDTGWRGTIQSLLACRHPDREFWGANFGRYGEVDPAISPRLLGIGFSGHYDPDKPLSAVVHHRHLIEALFEPIGASIEAVEEEDGAVRPVGIEAFTSAAPRPSQPELYDGMLRYLREVAPDLSYSSLLHERDLAAKQIAQHVLFPTPEMARVLGAFTSSFDFGRHDRRPVLLDPTDSRSGPEERIKASLWKQGQIALECRPAIARERQATLVPRRRGYARTIGKVPARDPACPKVAIIMRTKDRLLFLQRAFEGIARQTFDDYVLVVFNDGGDIVGLEAELELSRLDRRKVILLDGGANRGMEAASNAAIRHVNSEYVVIHDDDDSWTINFLEKTVAFLDANPGAAGVVTRSFYLEDEICGDQALVKKRSIYNPGLSVVQLGDLLAHNLFPPISFLFRRSFYVAVGGFDEELPVLGDWLFNINVAARGEIGVIPEVLANYHFRSASGSYANSIVGGSDLHARYNPIVRRKLTELHQHPAMAGAALLSPIMAEVRGMMRSTMAGGVSAGGLADAALAISADHRWCMLAYVRAHPDRAQDVTLEDALKFAADAGTPTPPDFDEVAYLEQNRDVDELVRTDQIKSGFVHFVLQGRGEGRRRPTRSPEVDVI